MIEFYPPIEERETDDLISLSQASPKEYRPEAILLAKKELKRRGLTEIEIKKKYKETNKRIYRENYLEAERESKKGLSIFEKLFIILSWPHRLLFDFDEIIYGKDKKSKESRKFIIIGIIFYLLLFTYAFIDIYFLD